MFFFFYKMMDSRNSKHKIQNLHKFYKQPATLVAPNFSWSPANPSLQLLSGLSGESRAPGDRDPQPAHDVHTTASFCSSIWGGGFKRPYTVQGLEWMCSPHRPALFFHRGAHCVWMNARRSISA